MLKTTLTRVFDTQGKRDNAINNLITFAVNKAPSIMEFSNTAAPLIAYFARNPNDTRAGGALLQAAEYLEQNLGQADANIFHYQMMRDMIHAGRETQAGGEFTATLSKLAPVFARTLETRLSSDRNRNNNVSFMGLGTEYSSQAFGCGVLSHLNSFMKQASSEAFLKVVENEHTDMDKSNLRVAAKYVMENGNTDQKNRLITVALQYLGSVQEILGGPAKSAPALTQ
jgi:hypothetical protein